MASGVKCIPPLYYIRAELPGLKNEDLDIQATGKSISISGQKKIASEVDIFETETQITLLADMPGVASANLNIDLRDDTLTIAGDIDP